MRFRKRWKTTRTYYNLVRIHRTLRGTPAMVAGVSKKLWKMNDVVDIIQTWKPIKYR